jgi:hypothetical protein
MLCDGVLGLRSLLARVPGINNSVNDSDGDRWSLEGYWRTFELYHGTAQDCADVWVSSMGGTLFQSAIQYGSSSHSFMYP